MYEYGKFFKEFRCDSIFDHWAPSVPAGAAQLDGLEGLEEGESLAGLEENDEESLEEELEDDSVEFEEELDDHSIELEE